MLVVRCAAALGLLGILVGGCVTTETPCCGLCPASEPAVFELSCGSTDLTSVVATGPCATPYARASSYVGDGMVMVASQSAGACHVVLTFATGFTYSADVTFTSKPGGVCGGPQCKCPDPALSTSGPIPVNNPSNTCVDAGLEGARDAGEDAATCPSSAFDSVACATPGRCTTCRSNARVDCTCGETDASVAEGGGLQWQCVDTLVECTPRSP
jgi:hypothetical protein